MSDSVDGLMTEVARQSLWADRIEKELQMTDMTPVKFMTSPGKVNPMPKKPTQHNPVASQASNFGEKPVGVPAPTPFVASMYAPGMYSPFVFAGGSW